MSDQPNPQSNPNTSWAIVALMGHTELAGQLTRPGEFGGLWQLDIPDENNNGGFRTEFFGSSAVFRIRLVSEEIARAYASSLHKTVIEYSAPIITRSEHMSIVEQLREQIYDLKQRLALPAPGRDDDDYDDESGEDDDPF